MAFQPQCLAAVLATIALAVALVLPSGPARATDATWLASPVDTNFDNGDNWSFATVPNGTVFFGISNTTSLTLSTNNTMGCWTFNSDAVDYTFTNHGSFIFNGNGIVINGGSATITNNNSLYFTGGSTGGTARLINGTSGSIYLSGVGIEHQAQEVAHQLERGSL